MTPQDFIKKHPDFIWWTTNYESLDEGAIVEATLNFGDWADVQELVAIIGMERIARIFRTQAFRARSNYHPKTKHFFTIYFDTYAPGNP